MVTLYIRQQRCDLPEDGLDTALSFAIQEADRLASPRGDASYTIQLPPTARNHRLMGALTQLDVALDGLPPGAFDPMAPVPAQLYEAGQLLVEGSVRLLSYDDEGYELQLLGGNMAWGEQLKRRRLAEVDTDPASPKYWRWVYRFDIGQFAQVLGHSGRAELELDALPPTAAELHDGFQALCWPFVAYNHDKLAQLGSAPLPLAYLRPGCYVAPLLLAHFQQLGYRLVSEWLEGLAEGTTPGEWPLVLGFAPPSEEGWTDFSAGPPARERIRLTTDGTETPVPGQGIFLSTFWANKANYPGTPFAHDYYGEALPAGGPPYQGMAVNSYRTYELAWQVNTHNPVPDQPTDVQLRFRLKDNQGNQTTLLTTGTVQVGTAWSGNLRFSVPASWALPARLEPELWVAAASDQVALQPDSWVALNDVPGQTVAEGQLFDLRQVLPDLTVAELLEELATMFNLRFLTDHERGVVYMEPYERFFRERDLALAPAVDRSRPLQQELASAQYGRVFQFRYRNDGRDEALAAAQPSEERPYGSYRRPNPNKNTTGEETIELKHFAPSVQANNTDRGLHYLALRQTDYPDFSTDFTPRLFALRRGLAGASYTISFQVPVTLPDGTSYTDTGLTLRDYPEPLFDVADYTLRFDDTPAAFGLFQRYYRTQWAHITEGRWLRLQAILGQVPLAALRRFDQSLHWLGHRLLTQAIEDYRPGKSTATLSLLLADTRQAAYPDRFAFGHCLALNGSAQYAQAAGVPNELFGPWDFSLSCWFYAEKLQGLQTLLYMGGTPQQAGVRVVLNGAKLEFWLVNSHAAGSLSGNERVKLTAPVTADQWHFIALVKNEADGAAYRTCLDGQLLAMNLQQNALTTDADLTASQALYLGSEGGSKRFLQGRLDELVLQRKRIGEAELAWRYNDGRGHAPRDLQRLLLYYRFDERYGPALPDASPLGLNGTLQGYSQGELSPGGGAWVPHD